MWTYKINKRIIQPTLQVRGHGGNLYFKDTIVTSWDTPNEKPQEKYEGGRSFLNCVSEKTESNTNGECIGFAKNDMGECRMDIIDTEIGYLGYFESESYGLTWKVRKQQQPLSVIYTYVNISVVALLCHTPYLRTII